MKRLLSRAFISQNDRLFHYTQDILALVTIVSIVALVLETVPSLKHHNQWFVLIEWVAVVIFSAEYIARVYVTKPARSYMCSFFGIIDIVSILPTILGLGNFTWLKSARALRIIRLLRMLRLAKVTRRGVSDEDVSVMSLNVLIYFVTLLLALLATGTAMYLVEPQTSAFASIPAGMWWSLKVFMAGIPVAEPITAIGEFFFVLTRFVGLLLLGLLIGVVGNVFKEMLVGKK